MWGAIALKTFGSWWPAVAKAHAIITRQRKLNSPACLTMRTAESRKTSEAQRQASPLTLPSLAYAHRSADISKVLNSAICFSASTAIFARRPISTQFSVAKDHGILLSTWHWGVAPPASDLATAAWTPATMPPNTRCWCKMAWLAGSCAVSLARRCNAVVRLTRFILGRCASIVATSTFKSPLWAAATTSWLITGKVALFAALAGLGWARLWRPFPLPPSPFLSLRRSAG
mmetsp:Transcript_7893/g.17417  ORF Transcript_7893/g.17417 Transcript_7893/m.17417 type:complete len:230 (-) Transcript_7893:182-871(-)